MSRVEKGNIPKPYNIIQNERKKFTGFNVDNMYVFLEGNDPENAAKTLDIARLIERDVILRHRADYHDNTTKKDVRRATFLKVKQVALFAEKVIIGQLSQGVPFDKVNLADFKRITSLLSTYDPQVATRISVHAGLFFNAIRGNGTKEQYRYWAFEKGGLYCKEIYGCFAMTELAHGSNVAGLETTAEYDFKTKSFTINTPHLGATKWWIGGAAHSANYCVCYARLVVKGKDYGVKQFVVPLRDSSHHLFSGVSIGDIGSKMGREGIDNGWIQFTNVKIPKNFLLQKYAKIDDDAQEVIDSPMDQLAYGALLDGRVSMVTDSFRVGAKAVTIALRYAVCRRQFGKSENPANNFASEQEADKSFKLEKQLIDYPSHQYRLIPLLATVYCLSSCSFRVQKDHEQVAEALQSDNLLVDKKLLFETLGQLKEIFVISASTKASSTWFTSKTIDECRQSLGGHGYSAYSDFGKVYNDWVVQCTWEGDNTVLSMNAGRSMVKYRQAIKAGKPSAVPKGFLFFNNGVPNEKFDLGSLDDLLRLFDLVLTKMADNVIDVLPSYNNNFDKVAVHLIAISKFHCQRYYLESALLQFNSSKTSANIKPALHKLIHLFALYTIKENTTQFLKHELLDKPQLEQIDEVVFKDLLPYLRHQVIALTDSFKLSDFFINSPFGAFDGNIYNKYFDQVNLLNNNHSEYGVSDYQDLLVGLLQRPSVEQRELFTKSAETLKKLGK